MYDLDAKLIVAARGTSIARSSKAEQARMLAKIASVVVVMALGGAAAMLNHSAHIDVSSGRSAAIQDGAANQGSAAVQNTPAAYSSGMLPARLLECHLARITNFDPNKQRLPTKFAYEGDHLFRLFLPSIPVRTSEPPPSTAAPEPVDPATRIVADPDAISGEAFSRPFERVVDYWPERVELTTPLADGRANLIVLQPSAGSDGVFDIFMTRASDAMTFDEHYIYSGHCGVQPSASGSRSGSK